jgi:CelD/BcsL family acetyltransferase involved in cellulose biosynthesis
MGNRAERPTVEVIPVRELTQDLIERWESFREGEPRLRTPFFSSRFSRVVGQFRPNAKVAIFASGNQVIGFLPFESVNRKTIEPIGKAFNDAHGLICDPTNPIGYCEAVEAIGVKAYRFHAMAGTGIGDERYILGHKPAFLADLEAHPEGYAEFLESTRATIEKQRRKTKKMIKDLGPMRLELDCRDEAALQRTIELKREQYQRTFIFDILGVPWAKQMLRTLWEENHEPCRGLLSVLYAGDTMVAAHYGMIEDDWLHYWFPVYDPKYHVYSPGTAMFLEIARQAQARGVKKIDLGYGEQPYKHKFVDTITQMPYGCATWCPITRVRERTRLSMIAGAKRLPGKPLLKRLVRSVWPKFGRAQFE